MSQDDLEAARSMAAGIIGNVESIVVGNRGAVEAVVMALLCQGHVLIEGAPGTGKTVFARSLALSVNGSFRRVQCTSDLLPGDVTGSYVFDQRDRDFHFRPGPIMANLVLVDEINRAPQRTQSAFLECMEEGQVTVDGVTHRVPDPFLLIATRNPEHNVGTFSLPETELDRFLVRIRLAYPGPDDEKSIVSQQLAGHPILGLRAVTEADEVCSAQRAVREAFVDPAVIDYCVAVMNATRQHPSVQAGPSPRATVGLVSLARAHAVMAGRDFTLPDDVKAVATVTLGHRLTLTPAARGQTTEDNVIHEVLASVPAEPGTA